jgi:uncharacterized membrane protein YkoI
MNKENTKKRRPALIVSMIAFCLILAIGTTAFAMSSQAPAATNNNAAASSTLSATTEAPKGNTDAKQESTTAEENDPAYTASISLGTQDNGKDEQKNTASESQEDAALASKAKISAEQATDAVKAAFPDATTISKATIGDENGYLIYEVKVTQKDGSTLEVKVDAGNGKILSQENGTENNKNEKDGEETDTGADTDNVQEEVEE